MEEKRNEQENQGDKELEAKNEPTIAIPLSMVKLIVGVGLVILGLTAVLGWWEYLVVVIKGCIGIILILAGAVVIAIAKE